MKYDSILETVGNTPVVRINKLAPEDVNLYVKIEAFNPLGSVKDRLALGVIEDAEKSRRAQAGPDGDRGDQRQHRHRACHGLRRQGLSAGGDDGRDLQRRAAQADALPRRQGGADARGRARRRHGQQGGRTCRGAWLVPDPAVRERGQSRHAFAHHGARDPRGLQGREARLLGHRLRHRRHAEGRGRVLARSGRTPRSSSASRTTRRC